MNDYALEAVEDLVDPVSSKDWAEQCAGQLADRSCLDLDPDTAECDAAILEGCPNDDDTYGRPYSWLGAHALGALPARLRPHVCAGVDEWFVLDLDAGESVGVALISGNGSPSIDLHAVVEGSNGRRLENVGFTVFLNADDRTTGSFPPAPSSGRYYLSVDLYEGSVADVELAIGTDEIGVETEEIVYRALCARLHDDCAAKCSDTDFFCGASVEECGQAYARAAAHYLFGGDDPQTLDGEANACAAEISQRACGELGAQSTACGELLVTPCPMDLESYGRPWSGWTAIPTALPANFELELCQHVPYYYRIELSAGDRLALLAEPIDSGTNAAYAQLYPPSVSPEDPDSYLHVTNLVLGLSETISDPVPVSGSYYFAVILNLDGHLSLTVRKE